MIKITEQSYLNGTELVIDAGSTTESCDAGILISTLLIFVAKGDGGISGSESEKMVDLLASRLGTRSSVALEQLSQSIMALANDTNIAQTLHRISANLSTPQKLEVFDMLLQLAMVDGYLDPRETEAIHFSGQILGLSQDTIHSRLREVGSGS